MTNTNEKMQNNLGDVANIVLSFDTTGSMSACIMQVRENLRNLVRSMTDNIPDLKIGLIAHGDYCDGPNCCQKLDLTSDLEAIMDFILKAPDTSGGDEPECYELVLKEAATLSWPKEGGSLVMIGDAYPHTNNPGKIDWRQAAQELVEKNVKIFALQCLFRSGRNANNAFWEELAGISKTPLLLLEDFADSANTVEALAYASAGPKAYASYNASLSRRCSTQNLVDNAAKLGDYLNGP